jgi:hypothetical protein
MKNLSSFNFLFKRKCNICCITFALFVYGINKLLLSNITAGILEMFCRSFLNDLVCPLFFLGFVNIILLWIGFESTSYLKCLFIGMTAGMVWEYFAPVINPKAITDPWDLLCYFIGISIYYLILKIELNLPKSFKQGKNNF